MGTYLSDGVGMADPNREEGTGLTRQSACTGEQQGRRRGSKLGTDYKRS